MTTASPSPRLPPNAPRIRMDATSARYMSHAVLAISVALAVFAVILINFYPEHHGRLPSVFVALVVCGAVLLPLRRGDGPRTLTRLSYGSLLYLAVAAVTGGGLEAPVMIALPLLVMIPGWLLGRRVARRLAAICLVLCVGLWLAGDAGWINQHSHLPGVLRLWIDFFVIGISLVLTTFAVNAHKQRVLQIHRLNDDLTAAGEVTLQQMREFETLANNLPALVMRLDNRLRCRYANDAFVNIQKLGREQLLGKHVDEIFTEPRRSAMHVAIQCARNGELNQLLAPYVPSTEKSKIFEGNIVHEVDTNGHTAGFLCLFYDVTEREQMQVELRHAASHDNLTGLSNRLSIEDRLENAVARSEREQLQFAVLAIDLDGFKPINDNHGHAAGDALLMHVAAQLVSSVRGADSVGRVGGDEFVVVLENIQDLATVKQLAEKILLAISVPQLFEGQSLAVGASIGIAMFPEHAVRPRELLRMADHAMYQAKHAGKNCVRFAADAVPPEPTFESSL